MKCSIAMYHYVRDLENSEYPNIRGLRLKNFVRQLDFFAANFKFISCAELLEAVYGGKLLPENAVMLTFDDGYIDCYENVFPILKKRGIFGVFAMPGKILSEQKVLNVNKIHFLLASKSIGFLKYALYEKLDYYRGKEFQIPSNEDLYRQYAKANRFDNEDVIFFKRVLQNALPENLRKSITNGLFHEYVCDDEAFFVKSLYLSGEQIKEMRNFGMEFALHGYEHYWFDKLSESEYIADIQNALAVFDGIIDKNNWTFCYPYGAYSEGLIEYCKLNGCKAGFTVEARTADLKVDLPHKLPRFDTNDFPPVSENYKNK